MMAMKQLNNQSWKLLLMALVSIVISSAIVTSCSESATGSSEPVKSSVDYRTSNADVVVLSFFDMYCPHCQKNAKYINELAALSGSQGLGSQINFYAIGWNNTPMEVEMYRKRYKVTYPVISDRDRSISSRFGKFSPPLVIALKKQGGQWKEFYRVVDTRGKTSEILSNIRP